MTIKEIDLFSPSNFLDVEENLNKFKPDLTALIGHEELDNNHGNRISLEHMHSFVRILGPFFTRS